LYRRRVPVGAFPACGDFCQDNRPIPDTRQNL
jgi:hypothetical protein